MRKFFPRSAFAKNALTLMTGTVFAQALPIAITPILTRLYSPTDFGFFAVYLGIVSILSAVATGRYDMAVLLPKKDSDAASVLALALAICIITSIATFLILLLSASAIAEALGAPSLYLWLFLIPVSILLTGIYQTLHHWSIRRTDYRRVASTRVILGGATGASQLAMGPALPNGGLILGSLVGQAVSTASLSYMVWRADSSTLRRTSVIRQLAMARRYKRFPKFLVLSHGMNAASAQAPVLLLASFFSAAVSGHFSLTQRVIRLPMGVISGAISEVFRQQASQIYAREKQCGALYDATLSRLLMLGLLPFVAFFFAAPPLFSIVFGPEWERAGVYARILTPMLFCQFISSPLSSMYMIAEKQHLDLALQTVLLLLAALPFMAGRLLDWDDTTIIAMFSASYSIVYIVNILITRGFAKNEAGAR